jgi:hypothetical protein
MLGVRSPQLRSFGFHGVGNESDRDQFTAPVAEFSE